MPIAPYVINALKILRMLSLTVTRPDLFGVCGRAVLPSLKTNKLRLWMWHSVLLTMALLGILKTFLLLPGIYGTIVTK